MKYLVYLTYCLASKKIYIGVHETENPDKFDGYLGNGVRINVPASYKHPTTPFKRAVKKYGIDQFRRITISIFDTKEEAYSLEAMLVNEEFIKRDDTYNIKLGGSGGCPEILKKKVYMYDSNGDFVKEFDTVKACMNEIDPEAINQSRIARAIKYGKRVRNFQFSYEKVPCMKKLKHRKMNGYTMPNQGAKVGQYTVEGELVKVYDNMTQCVKAGFKNAKQVALGKRNFCKGFIFKYLD